MMGWKSLRLCLMALLCAMTCDAVADEPPPPPAPPEALTAFSARPDQHQAVFTLMQAQWNSIFAHCDDLSADHWIVVENFPVTFDNLGAPIQGAWFDEAVVTGCQKSRKLSVLSAIVDGKLVHLSSMPGTTVTDFVLQQDSLPSAYQRALAAWPADCEPVVRHLPKVIDTRFVKFNGAPFPGAPPGRQAQPWLEEWVIKGDCGSRAVVTMQFTPDATGTAFTAGKAEALPPGNE